MCDNLRFIYIEFSFIIKKKNNNNNNETWAPTILYSFSGGFGSAESARKVCPAGFPAGGAEAS